MSEKPHCARFGVFFDKPQRIGRVQAFLSWEKNSPLFAAQRSLLEIYDGRSWKALPGTEQQGSRAAKFDVYLPRDMKPLIGVAVRVLEQTPDSNGLYCAACLEFEVFDHKRRSITRPTVPRTARPRRSFLIKP